MLMWKKESKIRIKSRDTKKKERKEKNGKEKSEVKKRIENELATW